MQQCGRTPRRKYKKHVSSITYPEGSVRNNLLGVICLTSEIPHEEGCTVTIEQVCDILMVILTAIEIVSNVVNGKKKK